MWKFNGHKKGTYIEVPGVVQDCSVIVLEQQSHSEVVERILQFTQLLDDGLGFSRRESSVRKYLLQHVPFESRLKPRQ